MKLRRNNEKGFSLIELIVVMTIVVVLSTIALISYGSTNKKARDGRRLADLQKVAIALEMIRQVGGTYPSTTSPLIPTYLQVWPTDPKGFAYLYTAPTVYTYTLNAQMEDLGSTNMAGTGDCGGTNTCNYRITNP